MELDARLLLTLGGMLVSVVSAAAIVRQKLATVIDQLDDIEKRLREIDKRCDQSDLDTSKVDDKTTATNDRVDVLRDMFDPSNMDKNSREIERLKVEKEHLRRDVDAIQKMHNGRHLPIKDI